MKYLSNLFGLFVVTLAVSSVAAESIDVPPTKRLLQPSAGLEKLAKRVERQTLSNGLRVIFLRRPEVPIFSGYIWVGVGGVDEKPGQTGIAHLLEHMAFKGSTTVGTKDYRKERTLLAQLERAVGDKPAGTVFTDDGILQVEQQLASLWKEDEFSQLYQRRGATGLNAATSNDYTVYMVSLPSTAFEFWCWMESDRLLNPVFRQFYREREVVIEERRSRTDDNPGGRMYEALLATAYWSHPNRLPTIGWRSDIERLTTPMIEAFYQTYYRPDNMVLVLVGDVDSTTAMPLLEQYFGRLPKARQPLPQVRTEVLPQTGERDAIVEFDAQPQLMLAYHKPVYPDFDDAVFTLFHEVLANNRSSILSRELIEKRRRAISLYTSEAPGERYPSLFVVGGSPSRGVSNLELRSDIQQQLDRLKQTGFSDEQLDGAKRRLRVGVLSALDSNAGLARILGRTELIYGDWETIIRFYNDVFRVTNDDIKRVLQQYLVKSNRTTVRLEQRSDG